GALANEALEPGLHGFKRAMNRRELADRGARRLNDLGRPPERVRRPRELRERRDETARGENRDRGDEQRADEYGSKRLRQSSARSPVTRLDRQPPTIMEINADQEGRGQ